MKGSEFILDRVDLLCYKLNKISLNRGRSYIDSHEWLKNKTLSIYPKNNDDKCLYNCCNKLSKNLKRPSKNIKN